MIVGELAIALNLMSVAIMAFMICIVFISAIAQLFIPKLDKFTFTVRKFLLSVNVYAHSVHDVISGQKALSIAAKAINKMTFKDVGFAFGKLDEAWNSLDKSHFTISSIEDSYYVVKATNPEDAMNVYFKISKNGQVLAAKDKNKF